MYDGVGVLIGRFHTDELHEGHLSLLEFVKRRQHAGVLVLLGVPAAPPMEADPLDYRAREQMIRSLWPEAVVLPVLDCAENAAWSRRVDDAIESVFPARGATIYAGRDGCLDAYTGRHTKFEVPDLLPGVSGTDRRRAIVTAPPRNSSDFRAGVIWTMGNLPPRIFLTVDIAVFRWEDSARAILLGRKRDESGWRLPGGFVSLNDASTEAAARRECFEETEVVPEVLDYVGSFTVPDWRSKGRRDVKHLTILYRSEFCSGAARAGDDIGQVDWHDVTQLPTIQQVHNELVAAAIAADKDAVACT